jgi:hypothetical protein
VQVELGLIEFRCNVLNFLRHQRDFRFQSMYQSSNSTIGVTATVMRQIITRTLSMSAGIVMRRAPVR